LSDFHETRIFSIFFLKYSNTIFHENPSSGSRVFPCRQTDGRAEMTKPIVAFRNFANAPKNRYKSDTARRGQYTLLYFISRYATTGLTAGIPGLYFLNTLALHKDDKCLQLFSATGEGPSFSLCPSREISEGICSL